METNRQSQYWCFICEKKFTSNGEAQACTFCQNTAFEAITISNSNSQPTSFQVYQIPSQPQQRNNNYQPPPIANMFPVNFVQALQFAPGLNVQTLSMTIPQITPNFINTFNHIQQTLLAPGGGIANLLNSLFGQSNLTVATPEEINRLQKIDQVPECSICQQENDKIENVEERKGVKLKCGHMFHHHCIGPWFERTNTCPSCRLRI